MEVRTCPMCRYQIGTLAIDSPVLEYLRHAYQNHLDEHVEDFRIEMELMSL